MGVCEGAAMSFCLAVGGFSYLSPRRAKSRLAGALSPCQSAEGPY
jgi:hypothetical protein